MGKQEGIKKYGVLGKPLEECACQSLSGTIINYMVLKRTELDNSASILTVAGVDKL